MTFFKLFIAESINVSHFSSLFVQNELRHKFYIISLRHSEPAIENLREFRPGLVVCQFVVILSLLGIRKIASSRMTILL
jgi:hypothetical protein